MVTKCLQYCVKNKHRCRTGSCWRYIILWFPSLVFCKILKLVTLTLVFTGTNYKCHVCGVDVLPFELLLYIVLVMFCSLSSTFWKWWFLCALVVHVIFVCTGIIMYIISEVLMASQPNIEQEATNRGRSLSFLHQPS